MIANECAIIAETNRRIHNEKSEFKTSVFEVFSQDVDGMSYDEKMRLIEKYVVEYQQKNDDLRSKPNRGESWTDEELRVILQDAPTKSNCVKYAKIFGRGYGSIEQIYRWASTDDQTVKEKRPDDAFIAHVKQIAKEVGWRA